MGPRILIIVSVLAILIAGGKWIADGMEWYTKDRRQVTELVKDELFGTTEKKVKWIDDPRFGLLPDDATISALPKSFGFVLGVGTVGIIAGLLWNRRKTRTSPGRTS